MRAACLRHSGGSAIFALNASSMSSRYKGAFAEKLSEIVSVIKKVPGAVLFIDNLHMLINGTDGNSQEEYNALGHLAGDDSLRLITTSTFRAWRQTFSKDDLLTRRLQTVELAPVSRDEALRIVTGVLPKFEQYHGVHYAPEVAEGPWRWPIAGLRTGPSPTRRSIWWMSLAAQPHEQGGGE